jgi:hypothetical protein
VRVFSMSVGMVQGSKSWLTGRIQWMDRTPASSLSAGVD